METIKKTDEYTIYKKANGRHAIKDARRRWVNGDAKVAILSAEGLIKAPEPKPEPVAEEAADADNAETTDAVAEEASEDEAEG